jgi:thioredoxin-dependent peroxiredoxin
VKEKGGQVIGISTDDLDTLKRFKAETKAPFPLLSDPGGKVAKQFVGLMPIPGVDLAKRANLVIGEDRKVKEIVSGNDAIDPSSAVSSCPLHGSGS